MDLTSSQHFQPDVSLKILIPFGDVILYYDLLVMTFMTASMLVFQLSKDTLFCVAVRCKPQDSVNSTANKTCELLNQPQLTGILNSECLLANETIVMFYQAATLLLIFNLCLVLNPRCSHTLQQFVRIVKECYECIGTPEQISSVLQSHPESPETTDEQTPLVTLGKTKVKLDEATETRIKTIYHKVKTFGDLKINDRHLRRTYMMRAHLLMAIPLVMFVCNIIIIITSDVMFRLISPFRCTLDNPLPITYDYVLCSRHMASFLQVIYLAFMILLGIAEILGVYSQFHFFFLTWGMTKLSVPECCGKGDLAFLCYLLKQYSHLEYERFVLFYSMTPNLEAQNGARTSC